MMGLFGCGHCWHKTSAFWQTEAHGPYLDESLRPRMIERVCCYCGAKTWQLFNLISDLWEGNNDKEAECK